MLNNTGRVRCHTCQYQSVVKDMPLLTPVARRDLRPAFPVCAHFEGSVVTMLLECNPACGGKLWAQRRRHAEQRG